MRYLSVAIQRRLFAALMAVVSRWPRQFSKSSEQRAAELPASCVKGVADIANAAGIEDNRRWPGPTRGKRRRQPTSLVNSRMRRCAAKVRAGHYFVRNFHADGQSRQIGRNCVFRE